VFKKMNMENKRCAVQASLLPGICKESCRDDMRRSQDDISQDPKRSSL